MVHALRRAHRMVTRGGCVVDLHPTADVASVTVGARVTGRVDASDASIRHAAADAALATIVGNGLFAVDRSLDFRFYTDGDTIEELRDYIVGTWRNARIGDDTLERTREALRHAPAARPRVREAVRVTKLCPR